MNQFAVSLHESFMSILLIPLNKSSSAMWFTQNQRNFYLKQSFVKVNTLLKFDRGGSEVGLSDSSGIEIEWEKQWRWITIRALCGKMFLFLLLYSVHSIQVLCRQNQSFLNIN